MKNQQTKNYKGVGWFWPMGDWKHSVKNSYKAGYDIIEKKSKTENLKLQLNMRLPKN